MTDISDVFKELRREAQAFPELPPPPPPKNNIKKPIIPGLRPIEAPPLVPPQKGWG